MAVTKRQVNKPVYAKHKLRKNISFVKNSLTATSTKKKKGKRKPSEMQNFAYKAQKIHKGNIYC